MYESDFLSNTNLVKCYRIPTNESNLFMLYTTSAVVSTDV